MMCLLKKRVPLKASLDGFDRVEVINGQKAVVLMDGIFCREVLHKRTFLRKESLRVIYLQRGLL